jgi:hypothetical protein
MHGVRLKDAGDAINRRLVPIMHEARGSFCSGFVGAIVATMLLGRIVLVVLLTLAVCSPALADGIDFAFEIRPLLANACYDCHGPDDTRRQGELRLDAAATWQPPPGKGPALVVPGHRDRSRLWQRITAHDAAERMPPIDSGKRLTPQEIERIGRWIDQGAKWSNHWAYAPPQRPAVPRAVSLTLATGPIDCFVQERLQRASLQAAPLAPPEAQLRRAALDLTGIPPTPEELAAFLGDRSPDAYERAIDRLLASPRFGERMAQNWLDLARYADTHGYHSDSHREMWRWRDWVIDAINANMPFDQFTVEQLAGDLLPEPTLAQRIATGFHRNNMVNFENGAIPAEYRTEYVVDRVTTTGTVWLGQTWVCARCHDHKYDAISQRDFYRLFAYFNNVPENGLDGRAGNAIPYLAAPTAEQQQQLAALDARLAQATAALEQRRTDSDPDFQRWLAAVGRSTPARLPPADMVAYFPLEEATQGALADRAAGDRTALVRGNASFVRGKFGQALLCDGDTFADLGDVMPLENQSPFSLSLWVFATSQETGTLLARVDDAFTSRGFSWFVEDGRIVVRLRNEAQANEIVVRTKQPLPLRKWQHVAIVYEGTGRAAGVQLYLDGKLAECEVLHDSLAASIATQRPWLLGRLDTQTQGDAEPAADSVAPSQPWRGMLDELRIYARALGSEEIALLAGGDPLREIIAKRPVERTAEETNQLRRYYLEHHDAPSETLRTERASVERELQRLQRTIPTSMVMEELATPRDAFILERGLYNRPGEKVTAGLPEQLLPAADGLPPNRLGLARWLVDRRHPLTARVAVNRYWAHFFGRGLVATPEDFGVRGAVPSHPELLDWLAVEFMENGWDVKYLVRLMVTSHAYRQASQLTPELKQHDPLNILLSRGPRTRLPAETLRDRALAVSGLLCERVGGPSVNPAQPADLWKALAYNAREFSAQSFRPSRGADLYRRGLYTFWKRASPDPLLVAFDAPNRETCTVSRAGTSSPLQALALLNDTTFVEAARALADGVLDETPSNTADRVARLFRKVLSRPPSEREADRLVQFYAAQFAAYQADPTAARELVALGTRVARDEPADAVAERAAWTTIAQALLNLEEFLTN